MHRPEGCPINVMDSEGRSLFHYAARCGPNETMLKKLVSYGGNIHLSDNFGMKFSDMILIIRYNFVTVKQFCVACGLECDNKDLLGVINTFHFVMHISITKGIRLGFTNLQTHKDQREIKECLHI